MPFDHGRAITEIELSQILEAARWAPTAHNMQNFEILVIDDKITLDAIGRIRTETCDTFLRENYAQMAFSEEELETRGTGVLASMFPPAWRHPDAKAHDVVDLAHAFLGGAIHDAPMILLVVYDATKRAPASEGDVLGFMSLGCVMQNMWLMAEDLGIGMQILSAFSGEHVESELRRLLSLPAHLKVAFACRLGHAIPGNHKYLRVRRAVDRFAHRTRYRESLTAAQTAKDLLG